MVLVIGCVVWHTKRINKNLDAHSPFCSLSPNSVATTHPCSWRNHVCEWVCLQAGAYIMLIIATYLSHDIFTSETRIFCFHCKRKVCESHEVTISFPYTLTYTVAIISAQGQPWLTTDASYLLQHRASFCVFERGSDFATMPAPNLKFRIRNISQIPCGRRYIYFKI